MRKQVQFTGIKGMNQDLSISKYSPEFTFKNYNMRINSHKESTMLTLTNSLGNTKVNIIEAEGNTPIEIEGTVINYTVINDYLVLFTTTRSITSPLVGDVPNPSGVDKIYRIQLDEGKFKAKVLFSGNLNFSREALIESIGIYESDTIIKVYWVDKNNQPRFINIMSEKPYTANTFEFCPVLNLNENVNVDIIKSGGNFHSGVIQYAFTYWNINGIETNIFLNTNLLNISNLDRGGSPEEIHTQSFKINLNAIDTQFDYLRVYAIHRTSLDSIPNVRIVSDYKLSSNTTSLSITDDGVKGSVFSADALQFIGGDELIIGTIATKDNVLFAGDITLKRPSLEGVEVKGIFTWDYSNIAIESYDTNKESNSGLYPYKPYTLTQTIPVRHWKYGETYRFGIRARYKTGIWSEVLHIGDFTPNLTFLTQQNRLAEVDSYINLSYVVGKYVLNSSTIQQLNTLGYRKVQLVYVPLTDKDRSIVGQGVLTNTIAQVNNRYSNTAFAYPDYLTRGNKSFWQATRSRKGKELPWEHLNPINYYVRQNSFSVTYPLIDRLHKEIEGASRGDFPYKSASERHIGLLKNTDRNNALFWEDYKYLWFLDNNLVNIWGPDIEHGNVRHNLTNINSIKFRGIANISGGYNNIKTLLKTGEGTTEKDSYFNYTTGAGNAIINVEDIIQSPNNSETTWRIYNYIWDFINKPPRYTDGRIDYTLHGNDKNQFLIEMTKRDYARFVYCGFNDMFISDFNLSINTPKFVDRDDLFTSYNTDNKYDGFGGSLLYNNHVEELGELVNKVGTAQVNYKANTHLLFSIKNSKYLPNWVSGNHSLPRQLPTTYYRTSSGDTNSTYTNDLLNTTTMLNKSIQSMKNRDGQESGYPFLYIVDLTRDISPTVKYGGNTEDAIKANVWIPAGPEVKLSASYLPAIYGDTFIQRYDTLRISNNTSTVNHTSEVLSVLLESYINLDGRYDTKRGGTGIENYDVTNYTHINDVYSQKDNFFMGNSLNYEVLPNDSLKASILVSQPKFNNSTTDIWTSLWLNNSYDADGSLGPINKVVRHGNDIWGFQTKGIFQVLYNSRVQIPVSEGVPIEIAQSAKMDGLRYISNSIGASNKWAIKQTNKSLYFMDSENKDIYTLGEGITNITENLGFKSWATKEITSNGVYNLDNGRDSFIFNTDGIEDDLYISNYKQSLSLSERLGAFESFHSYEDIPWMFRFKDKFMAIKTDSSGTTIWENNTNNSNTFFGYKMKSTVEFHVNPEPHLDKTFDNFEYRADILDIHNVYLAGKTFESVEVWNEYQYGSGTLNTPKAQFKNKKFRIWSFPFPRNRNSLDRIRNPWIKMRLTFNNQGNHRLYFHDMIVTYNI